MRKNETLFLIATSILYPLGYLLAIVFKASPEVYIILAPFYIFTVGWCAISLTEEREEE